MGTGNVQDSFTLWGRDALPQDDLFVSMSCKFSLHYRASLTCYALQIVNDELYVGDLEISQGENQDVHDSDGNYLVE